jgi:hypothetical protein
MSRVKLMSALAFDLQTLEESGAADPVLKVLGELPGHAQPFGINRVYKGPQGRYEEVVAIADPEGTIVWESAPRLLELRGMMFEDLFRREVRDAVPITSLGEHTVVLYLDGQLVGQVPVFIEAPESVHADGVLLEAAEVALKKGSLCWLTIPQPGGGEVIRPAWYVQQGQKLFVVKGEGEQELPGLESAATVVVTVKSKDIKATIGTLVADVRRVTDEAEFERIAALGLGTRLNVPDGEGALARWKDTATIVELSLLG